MRKIDCPFGVVQFIIPLVKIKKQNRMCKTTEEQQRFNEVWFAYSNTN